MQELGLDELMQLALQGRRVEMRDGLEQLKAELPPSTAPNCAMPLAVRSRSSRAMSESCSVAGIASGCSGPLST